MECLTNLDVLSARRVLLEHCKCPQCDADFEESLQAEFGGQICCICGFAVRGTSMCAICKESGDLSLSCRD